MPEIDLTDAASLPEGALQSFPTPDEGPEVLLVRHAGEVHAFAAHCHLPFRGYFFRMR